MAAGPAPARARLLFELLRAEGWRGPLARLLDRAAAARRARAFRPLPAGAPLPFQASVLNVLPTRPLAELGGVQVQLLERLESERPRRAVALLHPTRTGFRLELQDQEARLARELPGSPADPGDWLRVLRQARAATGAKLLHLENLAGLPAALLPLLAGEAGLVLSLHDLGAACQRVLSGEAPDPACSLARGGPPCEQCPRGPAAGHGREALEARAAAARLITHARALVLPSELLRRRLAQVFPAVEAGRVELVPPARTLPRLPPRPSRPLRHVAFVGAAHAHKGAAALLELVDTLPAEGLRFSALGGGAASWQARFRQRGIDVRGYYRDGTLPLHLQALEVDLVLLLSVWPESWGLTLDESWAADVAVLALDGGAPAERLRGAGGGRVVPLGEGAAGVARALGELRESLPAVPALERRPDLSPAHVAQRLANLYTSLLG